MDALNPQAEQMADESMVRTLAAQADAIWPQELGLLRRYGLQGPLSILDAGCGTGEATFRLGELYESATLLGVDIIDAHLARARQRNAAHGSRVHFEHRSIFDLGLPARSFDLVVCRHVIHSIPHPEKVLAELKRVTKPGGRLHVIAEDYGMIHFPKRELDADAFWQLVPKKFGEATGTDLFVGRKTPTLFQQLGLREVSCEYVVVDPLHTTRETFAAIFTAWRDGYCKPIAECTTLTEAQAKAHFDDQIATIREGYGAWLVPVISGLVP